MRWELLHLLELLRLQRPPTIGAIGGSWASCGMGGCIGIAAICIGATCGAIAIGGIGIAAAVGSAAAITLRGLICGCGGNGADGITFMTCGWFAIICAR